MKKTVNWMGAVAAAAVLAACGTTGVNPALEDARTVVNTTGSNADVARYAQLELKAATNTIAQADRVWRDDGDDGEVRHLSYLATQRAQAAQAVAQARAAEEQIGSARSEADRLRLEARTQQLQAAQNEALTAQQQAAVAQQEAQALQARLAELEAQQTERGLLVTLGDVLFEFGQSDLLASANPRMDKLAEFLQQFPERRVLIEGYTDSVGSDSINQTLSERRAAAVQSALVSRGINPTRITTQGHGKNHPVASNSTPEGRAMNRRVEVVIADEQGHLRSR